MQDLPDEMIMHIFGYLLPDYNLAMIAPIFFRDINELLCTWNYIFGMKYVIPKDVDPHYWPSFVKMFKDQTIWNNDSMIASTQEETNVNYLSRDPLPNNHIVCYCFEVTMPASGNKLGVGISSKKREDYICRFIGYDEDEYGIRGGERKIMYEKNLIDAELKTGDILTMIIDITSRRIYYMVNYENVTIQELNDCIPEEFYLGTTVFNGAVEILKMDRVNIDKLYQAYVKYIVLLLQ